MATRRRARRRTAMLASVELPAEPLRLSLEIERGVEPLSGRLRPQAGEGSTFVGWTGLAAALTAILDADGVAARPRSTPPSAPPTESRGID